MKLSTRRKFLTGVSLLGLGAAAGPLNLLRAAEGAAKIRLGTLVPRGSSYFKHLQMMGEKWRQAPGGGATLTIYPDGAMGGETDMVRRMRLGQLQAGMLTAVGLSEIEPTVAGLQFLPMIFRSLAEMDYVVEKLQPLLEKRLREKGFIVLFWADAGWVRFFSKEPVVRPEDLKRMKLFSWAGNADQVDIYKAAGFNPVPLETGDILPGLQTGLINAVPVPPFVALATQIDGPAPNMLDLNWGPLVGAAVLTTKAWETIPKASRDAVQQAAREAGLQIKTDSRKESVASVEAMRRRGLKVNTVTPDLEAEWRKQAEAVYPKIRGRIVPADIFDEVVRLVKEYRASQGGTG